MVKQTYLGLFVVFVVTSSICVFPAGLPQPADFLMAFLILVLATGFIVKPPVHNDLVFLGVLFVGYAALVNLFWYTQHGSKRTWMTSLYYAYDFGTTMVVLSLIREFRQRFVAVCQLAIAVAIVFEVAAVVVLASGFRAPGTFNNPNQLGYWAILLGCCYLVLKQDQKMNAVDFVVLCGMGYLTIESLSKAAMLSFVLLLLVGVVFQRMTRPLKLLFLALVFGGTAALLLDSTVGDRLFSVGIVERVDQRFEELSSDTNSAPGARGYDRIWNYPEHLLLGAGEGASERFRASERFYDPSAASRELHSTLGTVLFSYGLVGFSLFVGLIVMVFRRAPLAHKLYSLPIWTYGLTHQGLRDTMLWVFFGIVFGMAHYVRSPKPQRTVAALEPCAPADVQVTGHNMPASGSPSARR